MDSITFRFISVFYVIFKWLQLIRTNIHKFKYSVYIEGENVTLCYYAPKLTFFFTFSGRKRCTIFAVKLGMPENSVENTPEIFCRGISIIASSSEN